MCLIFWKVRNVKKSVFPVGIYEGAEKPVSFNLFISEYVNELKEIIQNGVIIRTKKYRIHVRRLYNGCTIATPAVMCSYSFQHIQWLQKMLSTWKISFQNCISRIRFAIMNWWIRTRLCPEHHTGILLLEDLLLDMIKCFPNHPMHMVHLATNGPQERWNAKITSEFNWFDQRPVKKCKDFFPREFQRKPRDLKPYPTWKAISFVIFYYTPDRSC